jgi:integration host factor subunit beta
VLEDGGKRLHGISEELKRSMLAGKAVELHGFGTLEVRQRKGRARNPKTGETVSVADHGVAAFRPGRELRKQAWTIKAPSRTKP